MSADTNSAPEYDIMDPEIWNRLANADRDLPWGPCDECGCTRANKGSVHRTTTKDGVRVERRFFCAVCDEPYVVRTVVE
jgi:hypothetical protein